MPTASTPSGGKGTGFLSGRFHTARIKLTAVYIAIVAGILLCSSGIIYSAFANQLHRRFIHFAMNPNVPFPAQNIPPRQQDVLRDLMTSLAFVNGMLLVAAGVSSYWLAGLTLRPIQDAYDAQRRFMGDASHELRTPLAILKVDLENRLHEPSLDHVERTRLTSNLEEVNRMSDMVSNLLSLTRLDEGEDAALHPRATVDLFAVARDVVQRFQPLATQANVTLTLTPTHAGPLFVKTNEPLVSQALANVVKNAITYNNADGTVTVDVRAGNDTATVTVTDTGIGIAVEDQQQIFERFYRADKSRSRATGGSGLGLAIARESIERLGGRIDVVSEVGTGTAITVEIPRV